LRNSLYIFTFLISLLTIAQELPPVVNFTPDNYGADNQNWMLSQDDQGRVYGANNKGLLEYNGSEWKVYPTHNESIMRSVNVIGDRIYTGCYMNFGYWERDTSGMLHYVPWSDNLSIEIIEDEQFWNIMAYQDWVIFQSLNRLIIVHTRSDQVHIIDPPNGIVKSFLVDGQIYYQVQGQGIYKVSEGSGQLITSDTPALTNRVVGMLRINNDLLVFTETQGIYRLVDERLLPYSVLADAFIKNSALYSVIKLRNNDMVLGTIGRGIIVISAEGELRYNIDKTNTLYNNTVLSLFEDQNQNIWMGLDNGIANMNVDSPVRSYVDITGDIGTTYDSAAYQDMLYLGTNHGLFVQPLDTSTPFKLVPGTEGQVWSLNLIDEKLYCGHNTGTFLIKDAKAELISEVQGTWYMRAISTSKLIQGKYFGLYMLDTKENGSLEETKLDGFDISSRQFEFSHPDTLLVNHEYKGVYKLAVDWENYKISDFVNIPGIRKSSHSSLIRYENRVFYANKYGIYHYDQDLGKFTINKQLSSLFDGDEYTSGNMVLDGENHLWIFTKSYLCRIQPQAIGENYKIDRIPIPFNLREELVGFENINAYLDANYLFGNSSGYLVIEPDSFNAEDDIYKVYLDQVLSASFNGRARQMPLDSIPKMESNHNNFEFHYYIPEYQKFSVSTYQYKLEGLYEDWSNWSNDPSVAFNNLSPGEYTFRLRGRVNNTPTDNEVSYSFSINPPWYATTNAIIVYSICSFLLILLINYLYKRYYRRQQKRLLERTTKDLRLQELANKQQITELQNENLQKEIDSRTRELTLSAMNTVNKNSLLSQIKTELNQANDPKDIKRLISIIDNNMDNQEDWKSFEEAFNHADKDFFKNVKQKHPEFTSGDLRLCMYLRLNLSSKEIAPLLNISVRSVEIKRYRLRKKAGIEREIDLNQYFMEL